MSTTSTKQGSFLFLRLLAAINRHSFTRLLVFSLALKVTKTKMGLLMLGFYLSGDECDFCDLPFIKSKTNTHCALMERTVCASTGKDPAQNTVTWGSQICVIFGRREHFTEKHPKKRP